MKMPNKAAALTALMALLAIAAIAYAASSMQPFHQPELWVLMAVALCTARLKVKLPGLTGNMAVCLPFLLIAVARLSMLEALMVALPAALAQSFPKKGGKLKPLQMTFNFSTMAVAVALSSTANSPFLMAIAFFLGQTIPVATVIRLTEGGALGRTWFNIAHFSLPFYVLSAGIVALTSPDQGNVVWQSLIAAVPVLYLIYRSYQSYFRRELSTSEG
jgi:hypothetical protein